MQHRFVVIVIRENQCRCINKVIRGACDLHRQTSVYTTCDDWLLAHEWMNQQVKLPAKDCNRSELCKNFTTSDRLNTFLKFRGFMSIEQFWEAKKINFWCFRKFLRYFFHAASSSILRWSSLKLFIKNKYLKRNCLSSICCVDWWLLLSQKQVPRELESSFIEAGRTSLNNNPPFLF